MAKNVIGKGDAGDSESDRIFKRIESENVNKRYASAQVVGGDKLGVDGPGSGRKANGVVKAR